MNKLRKYLPKRALIIAIINFGLNFVLCTVLIDTYSILILSRRVPEGFINGVLKVTFSEWVQYLFCNYFVTTQ